MLISRASATRVPQPREDPHGVQALLAALRRQQDAPSVPAPASAPAPAATTDPRRRAEAAKDLRHLTFLEALPLLTALASDAAFLASLRDLKHQQDTLERALAKDYSRAFANRSHRAHDETAWLVSALAKWDAARKDQQKRLQHMGTPCFFVSDDKDVLARQNRVMAVLENMLEEHK